MSIITLVSILLTITVYILSRKINAKFPSPLTTPVFLSTMLIIILLRTGGVSYGQYEPAKEIMTFLLGPATVALAIPIYKHRKVIAKYSIRGGIGLFLGSTATLAVTFIFAKLFHVTDVIIASLSVKSATVPIAIEVSKLVNGDPALAAVFVVITGVIGAMFGPWILDKLNVTDPISRGLAMGTIAHGIGTAEIAKEGQIQAAISGIAMVLGAVLISIIVPLLYQFI